MQSDRPLTSSDLPSSLFVDLQFCCADYNNGSHAVNLLRNLELQLQGSSILRMLHTYINHTSSSQEGPALISKESSFNDPFLRGIRAYLVHFKFGNAETQDLWKIMSNETGRVSRFGQAYPL